MSSIIPGYNYDIFISYRQKDNKGDKWVSEFVEALKTELESTFKEDISVYFDINPHDGLLETHDVDESLKEKLKCLIFIPIISRTYCDPKSFAWKHEFKAFIRQASNDHFGLKIKLPNGNMANRLIPVQIHELHSEDKALIEKEIGGVLRSIEFIYKSAGVNRPLLVVEAHPHDNINKIYYRDQINKVANAIDEVIHSLKGLQVSPQGRTILSTPPSGDESDESKPGKEARVTSPGKGIKKWLIPVLSVALIVIGTFAVYMVFEKHKKNYDNSKIEKSIAVLPFKLLSDEPDKQYLADGMMDAITLHLSKIKDLRVLSRTSTEQYRNPTKTTSVIGKELGVNYLLEGSFQKIGNNVRLIIQLIRTGKEGHVWANEYDREWEDVFSVQSEVAKSIAGELDAVITPREKKLIETVPTSNLTAYDYYQRGMEYFWDFALTRSVTITGDYKLLDNSAAFFKKALKDDSTFAKAYAGLARVYFIKYRRSSETYFTENYLDSLLILTDKALSLDASLPEAYYFRAEYYLWTGKSDKAKDEIDKAIFYDPNYSEAYEWKGFFIYLHDLNNLDFVKGLEYLLKAASLNHGKEFMDILGSIGHTYAFCAGFPEEAKKCANEIFILNGDTANYLSWIGSIEIQYGNFNDGIEKSMEAYSKDSVDWRLATQYLYHGDYKKSLGYFKKYFEKEKVVKNIPIGSQVYIGYAYLQNGFKKEAEYWFKEHLRLTQESIKLGRYYSTSVYFSSNSYYDLACLYAFKGDKDKALELLKSFEKYRIIPISLLDDIKTYNPLFNNLRNDPEFQQIVKSWNTKYQAEHERVKKWLEEQGKL